MNEREVSVPAPLGPLEATLVTPAGPGPHPGVVLVGGSGPTTRRRVLPFARALAARGVAALAYNKRLENYGWRQRSFASLAQDAVAGVELMHGFDEIDGVGLVGWSEGGWVCPLAVERAGSDVVALALLAAPSMSPLSQQWWSIENFVRRLIPRVPGAPVRALNRAGEWIARRHPDSFALYDPRPALAALSLPVLAVQGTKDGVVPVVSLEMIRELVPGADVVAIDGVGHRFAHGGKFDAAFLDTVASWLRIHVRASGTDERAEPTQPNSIAASS